MKILVDSDWILELLVNRSQYGEKAEKLLKILNECSQAQVYATELCLDKINSFLGKEDLQLGRDAVSWVKDLLNDRILPFNKSIRDSARKLCIKDFESAVEVAIAKEENIGVIITLNSEIFAGANLPILDSNLLIERLLLEQAWNKNNSSALLVGNLQTIERLNKLLQVENIAKYEVIFSVTVNIEQQKRIDALIKTMQNLFDIKISIMEIKEG